jgi:hypothetical protein
MHVSIDPPIYPVSASMPILQLLKHKAEEGFLLVLRRYRTGKYHEHPSIYCEFYFGVAGRPKGRVHLDTLLAILFVDTSQTPLCVSSAPPEPVVAAIAGASHVGGVNSLSTRFLPRVPLGDTMRCFSQTSVLHV